MSRPESIEDLPAHEVDDVEVVYVDLAALAATPGAESFVSAARAFYDAVDEVPGLYVVEGRVFRERPEADLNAALQRAQAVYDGRLERRAALLEGAAENWVGESSYLDQWARDEGLGGPSIIETAVERARAAVAAAAARTTEEPEA